MNYFSEEYLESIFFGKNDKYDVVEITTWEADEKADYADMIFTDNKGNFYCASISRMGDDYFFDEDVCDVEKKEVVKYEWVAK